MFPLIVSPLATVVVISTAALAIVGGAYFKGRQDGRAALLADQVSAAAQVAKAQDRVTERVVVEYRDVVKVVKEKGEEVIREVEKLVPANGCRLDGGFRVLHDAAADGALPVASAGAHGPAAPVEQIAAAETVAGNYLACHENAVQLKALQGWIEEQQNVNKGGTP